MQATIITALFLSIPLLISGSLHMLIVTKGWFASLAIPISEPNFGKNKTWRGVVVMLLFTIPGVYLAVAMESNIEILIVNLDNSNSVLLGLALGLGYILPELPNSYLKRRLNIAPGERSSSKTLLFSFIDQADSAIGCALVYWLFIMPPVAVLLWIVILGPLIHLLVNLLLFSIGLRKQPF